MAADTPAPNEALKQQIMDRLKLVNDPELHRDLVTLNRVKHVAICEGYVKVTIELSTATGPMNERIEQSVQSVLRDLPGVGEVKVAFSTGGEGASTGAKSEGNRGATNSGATGSASGEASSERALPGVKHIIAVGAGKGGVGKSTVSVNLAVGLARAGAKVGLLDGDIYGPSLPTMLGLDGMDAETMGPQTIKPFEVSGIKAMTLGKLVEADKPLIWRGPMAHSAFRQLAMQTAWGELDYLIIDLPPGTGDVPLTMSQLLPLTGAVVVCTPQKVAQDDARRAVKMFESLSIPVLGVVENMSYFIGDDGKEYDLFGRGGAEVMAKELGVEFLGMVPINTMLRKNSDSGNPTANFENDAQLGEQLTVVVDHVRERVEALATGDAVVPTISIS